MAKHSLKLLFLRKYRTSKKLYKQLKLHRPRVPSSVSNSEERNDSQVVSHVNESFPSEQRKRKARNNSVPVDSVDCCLLICDCVAQNKLRTFVFVIAVSLFSTLGMYLYDQNLLQYRIYREDVFSSKHGIRLKRCSIPNLKPFSSEVRPFIYYTNARPNCAHEQPNVFSKFPPYSIRNGSLLVRHIEKEEAVGCCYRPFFRNGDNNVWSSHSCHDVSKNRVTVIPPRVEYIELLCINSATDTDFRDAFALFPRKDPVEGRVTGYDDFFGEAQSSLSVVVLGLDATSRMNFIRAMPKSNRYLLKNLSAISLNGYTKVAENTLPNIIPLLTGRTLEEFKGICVDELTTPAHIHLDGCPFIWKDFAKNGYRTSLAEDDVDIGIFNMNWAHAFSKPPTDYYLRPFSVLMQRHHSFRNGFCYGPNLSFEKILENIRSMAETFHKQLYFQFTWSTKLSHDDLNKMRWGDEPLLNLLKYLHSNDHLNNTAFFVIGDHGSRLDRIRSTDQGKLEDRMPIAYVVLPEWFKRKFTKSYKNLQQNSNRITSAFDIHKTLYEFLNLDNLQRFENAKTETGDQLKLLNNDTLAIGQFRGSSLFQDLPDNRTCFAAGIPLHWCICHKKIPQDTDSDMAKDVGEFIVTSINSLLKGHGSCAKLRLKKIDEVSEWDPSEIIRDGCETNSDMNNKSEVINNFDSCNNTDVIVLQVAVTVTPSDATFETTVLRLNNGKWRLTEDVVRTNSYEGQSGCVEQKFKPYCYCLDDGSIFDRLF